MNSGYYHLEEKYVQYLIFFVHFAELAEGVRAGTKAAAVACVASAIPTVRELSFSSDLIIVC